MKKELYIGLDVHREAVAIAVAEQGRKGEVRDYGQISNDLHALEKFITRLRQTHGKRVTLRACYEERSRLSVCIFSVELVCLSQPE